MQDTTRLVQVVRAQSDAGHIEFARREPPPGLQPYIRDVCGYTERTGAPLQRREFPGPQVVVIIEFAPPIHVFEAGCTQRSARYPGGFAAGITDQFTLTQHDGFQRGLQINLTPIGARRFFGLPLSELAGRAVSIRDLLPPEHRSLAEQLEALPDWEARFDCFEELLAQRIAGSDLRSELVSWALRYIEASGGAADMRTLARELGYSQKHVIHLFRDHVGVPPKLLARIVRFDRLIGSLRRGAPESWSELALAFGYYDQSHLVRDVRQFTGTTPTEARAMLAESPDPGP
ncbi:MAG TPA: helix-turn-helix domain-containing protein [Myxococcota bacterium]|nr:helix-turn-helix domain-containing protein [Myxococcota bacterium]